MFAMETEYPSIASSLSTKLIYFWKKMRNKKHTFLCHLVFFFSMGTLISAGANAETYPSKPIRLIVHSAAGGSPDTLIRSLSSELGAALGQPVIVENKPGAGGIIGITEIIRAPADGYTIGFANATTLAINQALFSNLPYDVESQLTPIGTFGFTHNALMVRSDSPFHSVRELIAHALANPGKLTIGSGGNGTTGHLSGELFKAMSNTEILHVPFRGSPQALQDLIAGTTDMLFDNIAVALPQVKSGRVRVLAVSGAKRAAVLPEVPTMAEAGLEGYETVAWSGLVAPAGTPSAIIDLLNSKLNEVLVMPVVHERLVSNSTEAMTSPPPVLFEMARKERPIWAEVVNKANAKVD